MGKFIRLISTATLLAVIAAISGCITPVGMYLGATRITAGSTDLEIIAEGQDTLTPKLSYNPGTNTGDAGFDLEVQGATRVISKGNLWRSEIAGRAQSVNASFLGGYQTDNADHNTNLAITQGSGAFCDVLRGPGIREDKANVPEYNFDGSENFDPVEDPGD